MELSTHSFRSPVESLRHGPESGIVMIAALAWVATSFWMNERLYANLLVPHGDSAMYEEHLWNVWHGKGFRSYLDQGLFLGEHIQVIHLLLLPLHMLWPSYLTLELASSSCLALCVIPIFSLALRHSGNRRAAMWLALAWLLFFPMHFLDIAIDIKTLRPSCYGLPFLFWGIDFAERRRLTSASVCLLIALSTQEDFALIVGPIGGVLWLTAPRDSGTPVDRRRFAVWSLGVLAFSIVYVILAVLVIIPSFRGGAVVHYSRYFGNLGNSPGDLVRTCLTDPLRVLSLLLSPRTLFYLCVLLLPLGLWPLTRPRYLVAGIATFGMLSLLQLGNDPTSADPAATDPSSTLSTLPPVPYHHFHAPLLPILFWAAAAALKPPRNPWSEHSCSGEARSEFLPTSQQTGSSGERVNMDRSWWQWRTAWCQRFGTPVSRARLAFFCALTTSVTGSLMPIGVNFWSTQSPFGQSQLYTPGVRGAAFPKVLTRLPPTARVASTDYVHTRLTHFERSYDYSDYVRAVNNYQPGVPADTDYIVIDTSHPYSRIRTLAEIRELQTEPERWEVLPDDTDGLFIVLKRLH